MKFFSTVAIWAFAAAMLAPSDSQAQEITCDTIYTTQSGDSLSRISQRAYGRNTAYQQIFDYNPGVMSDPSRLPVGVELYIPCDSRSTTGSAPDTPSLPDLQRAQ